MARAVRWVYEGVDAIGGISPQIDGLIDRYGVPPWGRPIPAAERFGTLARLIASQQLSGDAATAVWARVESAVGGGPVGPAPLLAVGPEVLRSAGLSRSKVAALHDLAARVDDGRLRLGRLGTLSDEEVIDRLVSVRGVGEWSAQMFLIGALRRGDVWPCGDVGVRTGWGRAHGADPPTALEMPRLGEPFRPYRSLVAWYCRRCADTQPAGR
ncbi:MAG: DNA-3-methyladenine glycosylase 2 family protein [Microthrixaceae bacterium]|nr:DNA-3-methyladenine glycosylase 2 family protein [Microthrixaceae bacterium]